MDTILINEAINTGNWYSISLTDYDGNLVSARFSIIGFEPIEKVNIDNNMFPNFSSTDGKLMLLMLAVVNTTKAPIVASYIRDNFNLIDKDGYIFDCYQNHGHILCSPWAFKSRVANFTKLHNPKIKFYGSISFLLPNDISDDLSIIMKDATMVQIDANTN